ncbi:MAG: DUF4399 domain-containing protein [Proteobacteria bacterium]|nr:DUF4399 domain-containing protein [Pseudomonadota bacterium]MBI3499828.1 DUF4399 domain-containing protein [Pseudomonadota bacterium]
MRINRFALLALPFVALALPALAQTPAPPGATVYFIEPADGASVKSPVTVKFGLKGIGVAPALVEWPNTGHHHLLVDHDAAPPGKPIPNDATSVHFGGGQTEAAVTLTPGTHTLLLELGDHQHIPHNPPVVSQKITVTVTP